MGISSEWSGEATAASTISGQESLSCSLKGSLVFTIFLSPVTGRKGNGGPVVPQNSVAGRMVGYFDAKVSTPTKQVVGTGTAEYTIGGTYDAAEETVVIAIRSSGLNANGTENALEKAANGVALEELPFSTTLNWGWQPPRDNWGWQIRWTDDPHAILDVMKPPTKPVIASSREADLYMAKSLPQTGLKEFQSVMLDLKNPRPQTVTQTFQDESGLGLRTTKWVFTLVPHFSIEREDGATDGRHSFVSTDFIRLRVGIPGVTVEQSKWANLASWEVRGLGPLSGSGVPDRLEHRVAFGFQPSPRTRPTSGSTSRNQPVQYTVSASFGTAVQYFLLIQDEVDLLRQEYIDHNVGVVPSREDCVVYPIDNSFNTGNYNLVVDCGMRAAFDKVAHEFGKDNNDGVVVVAGFRSPQRNKASGDVHPNNRHILGRALDLAPSDSRAGSMQALYRACIRAGYHTFCEASPGRRVPPRSRNAKYVHIDW